MKFSPLQLSFVMILFTGISNHVIILPHHLLAARRDAWVCSPIAYVFLLLWGMMIYLILTKINGQNLFDWIKNRAGTVVNGIIAFLMFLYLLFVGISAFYELILSANIYLIPQTPLWIIAISFLLVCVGASTGGFKTIVNMSTVFLPIVVMLGLFVAFASMKVKEYSFLFPVLIHGPAPLIKGTAIILGGNTDLLVLFLLQHHLKKSYSLRHLFGLITILILMVIGTTMGAISSFGPNVASLLRFPAFEQWRLVNIGTYISHFDFFAIFQLVAGSSIKVALCYYLLPELLKIKSVKLKKYVKFLLPLSFMSTVCIHSDIIVQSFLHQYIYPYLFLYGFGISFVLLIVSYLPYRKGIEPL